MPVPPPVTQATSPLIERCMQSLASVCRLEPECIAVAHDIASALPGEMAADDERARACKPLAHFAPHFCRLPLIQIDRRCPFEMRDLAGMMKDVAEQDRRFGRRCRWRCSYARDCARPRE